MCKWRNFCANRYWHCHVRYYGDGHPATLSTTYIVRSYVHTREILSRHFNNAECRPNYLALEAPISSWPVWPSMAAWVPAPMVFPRVRFWAPSLQHLHLRNRPSSYCHFCVGHLHVDDIQGQTIKNQMYLVCHSAAACEARRIHHHGWLSPLYLFICCSWPWSYTGPRTNIRSIYSAPLSWFILPVAPVPHYCSLAYIRCHPYTYPCLYNSPTILLHTAHSFNSFIQKFL